MFLEKMLDCLHFYGLFENDLREVKHLLSAIRFARQLNSLIKMTSGVISMQQVVKSFCQRYDMERFWMRPGHMDTSFSPCQQQ